MKKPSCLRLAALIPALFFTVLSLGAESFRLLKTEHFDIVYPPQSEPTAFAIAEKADALYDRVTAELGKPAWKRLPVYIKPSTQELNAYFTYLSYDHIVVYDTVPSEVTLASFTDNIVSVFYHELVHAVSLAQKDPKPYLFTELEYLFRWAQKLNMPLSFVEGATVSFESAGGEGRLHNGYVLQTLVQAKAEGKYKNWLDAAGNRDRYPNGNISYYFGGAFSRWLVEQYGMERYRAMWTKAEHLNLGVVNGIFKKIYGFTVQDAWNRFYETIPTVLMEKTAETIGSGHFGSYDSLVWRTGAEPGLVVLSFSDGAALFFPLEADGSFGKKQKLFPISAATDTVRVSRDGRYLAVSDLMNDNTETFGTRIYDIEKRGFVSGWARNLRLATFMTLGDGSEALVGLRTERQTCALVLYTLTGGEAGKGRLSLKEGSRLDFGFNDMVYGIAPGEAGEFVVLHNYTGTWELSLFSDTLREKQTWRFDSSVIPWGICQYEGNGAYSLSLAGRDIEPGSEDAPGAVSRYAKLIFTPALPDSGGQGAAAYRAELFVESVNRFGGVSAPTVLGTGNIAYVTHEGDGMRLVQDTPRELRDTSLLSEADPQEVAAQFASRAPAKSAFAVEKYNPFPYYLWGQIFPLTSFPITDTVTNRGKSILSEIGLSYLACDPTESVYLMLGGTVNPFANEMLFNANVSGGGDTFTWSSFISFLSPVSKPRLAELYSESSFNVSFPIQNGLSSQSFQFVPAFCYEPGKQFSAIAYLSETTSFMRRGGDRLPYTYRGVELRTFLVAGSENSLASVNGKTAGPKSSYINAGAEFTLHFPRLLPFENTDNITYTLPLTLKGSLFDTPDTLCSAEATVVIYSHEIQRTCLGLYTYRFTVAAGYAGTFMRENESWDILRTVTLLARCGSLPQTHVLRAQAFFEVGLPIGTFARPSAAIQLGLSLDYYLVNTVDEKPVALAVSGLFTF